MTTKADRLRIGISPCPNDAYAFHGLLSQAVRIAGVDATIALHDVQELNRRFLAGELDVAKVSFPAALLAGRSAWVLPVGAALGFGVGPLLLAATSAEPPERWQSSSPPVVLCPGEQTTANLLYKLFHPGVGEVRQAVFSAIMPALEAGLADYGVCIHEGRFTWGQRGLKLVEDLGRRWEEVTALPLPLGGIVARRDLPTTTVAAVTAAIGQSLRYSHGHRQSALATMRQHAQELADDVLWQHVELYVNDHTAALGELGRRALDELWRRAVASGAMGPETAALEVFADE